MNTKHLHRILIVVALYIGAQMLADVSSLRILFIAGLSIDGGTLVYPLTFTLRDMIHKSAGKAAARVVIFSAAGINILMAGLFWLVAQLPADMEVGEQLEFGIVLAPVLRIVLASIIAEVVSELIDTEVYDIWVKRMGEGRQWARVVSSNAVSVPVDSAIFCSIAFIGTMPGSVVWSIFVANVLVKGAMTVLSIPGIYMVKDKANV